MSSRTRKVRLVVVAAAAVAWLTGCTTAAYQAHDDQPTIPVKAGDGVQGSINRPACAQPAHQHACTELLALDHVASGTAAYYQLKPRDLGALAPSGAVRYIGSFWAATQQLAGAYGNLQFSMTAAGFFRTGLSGRGDTMTVQYRGGGPESGVSVTVAPCWFFVVNVPL